MTWAGAKISIGIFAVDFNMDKVFSKGYRIEYVFRCLSGK